MFHGNLFFTDHKDIKYLTTIKLASDIIALTFLH